jgi:hypothetical protein
MIFALPTGEEKPKNRLHFATYVIEELCFSCGFSVICGGKQ